MHCLGHGHLKEAGFNLSTHISGTVSQIELKFGVQPRSRKVEMLCET